MSLRLLAARRPRRLLAGPPLLRSAACRRFAGSASAAAEQQGEGETRRASGAAERVVLYEARSDLAKDARTAWARCQAGVSLGLVGFAGVLTGASANAGPAMPVVVCAGAAAYAYKHLVLSRRSMAEAAMRHVERVTITAVSSSSAPASASASASSSPDEASEAAGDGEAAEEAPSKGIAAAETVELEVQTANLELSMTLTEPSAGWEGAKYSGFVSDDRPSFGALSQGDLLYMDRASAGSADATQLAALAASSKVVAEQRVEARGDADGLLASPADGPKRFAAALSAAARADAGASGGRRGLSPAQEVAQLGQQALLSGLVFLIAGGLFTGRRLAQDAGDSQGRKDPTLQDLLEKLRVKG